MELRRKKQRTSNESKATGGSSKLNILTKRPLLPLYSLSPSPILSSLKTTTAHISSLTQHQLMATLPHNSQLYLDGNGTTPLHPYVLSTITTSLSSSYGNPSTPTPVGRSAKSRIDAAARDAKDFVFGLKRETDEYDKSKIIWSSCGTESNNLAIQIALKTWSGRRLHHPSSFSCAPEELRGMIPHVVSSTMEHPAVKLYLQNLVKEKAITLTLLPPNPINSGHVNVEDVMNEIRENETALVTLMYANNETGIITPITLLSNAVKERYPAVLVHTDAAQACGKIQCRASTHTNGELKDCDMITLVGHKMGAPKGIALLYLSPTYIKNLSNEVLAYITNNNQGVLFIGGGQGGGFRSGTENTSFIEGFGAACRVIGGHCEGSYGGVDCSIDNMIDYNRELVGVFVDTFTTLLGPPSTSLSSSSPSSSSSKSLYGKSYWRINSSQSLHGVLPNTLNVSFGGGVYSSRILHNIMKVKPIGVSCSAGSACHSHGGGDVEEKVEVDDSGGRGGENIVNMTYSNVLKEMGIPDVLGRGTLRISTGFWLTKEDCEIAANIVAREVLATWEEGEDEEKKDREEVL